MPKLPTHLGTKLAEAIKQAGISQADVARAFKVKPSTVSADWLKFGRIGKRHYQGLVTYFGKPYEWWFGEASNEAAPATRPTSRKTTGSAVTNGATIAWLCHDRDVRAPDLAQLLSISEQDAARLVSGDTMPTPEQRRLLGAIFNIDPDQITDAGAVIARPIAGNARKRTLALDGYEYQLIQQYRHLPEAAQRVLRVHAVRLEEAFAVRSPDNPFAKNATPTAPAPPGSDPSQDTDYGSW